MRNSHREIGAVVLLVLALVLAASGCAGVPESYLRADRGALDTIGRDFTLYVAADPALPDSLKALKIAAVEAWRVRVEEAEAAGE